MSGALSFTATVLIYSYLFKVGIGEVSTFT
jgi:hypothetical protein